MKPARHSIWWLHGLLLLLMSAGLAAAMAWIHAGFVETLSQYTRDVVAGHAPHVAFQNRLLGPALVSLIAGADVSDVAAFEIFTALGLALGNVLMYVLLVRRGVSPRAALVLVAAYVLMFLAVQNTWFYTWDVIDALVSTALAFGILQQKPLWYFVALFVVAIANRESGLFISAFIALDAFHLERTTRRWRVVLTSPQRLVLGLALSVAGMAYVSALRRWLYLGPPQAGALGGAISNHTHFLANVRELLVYDLFSARAGYSLFVLGSALYLLRFVREYNDSQRKALAVYLLMWLNILIFGIVHETRLFIVLLPFLIFFHVEIRGIAARRTA